jgi:hypothetical protein
MDKNGGAASLVRSDALLASRIAKAICAEFFLARSKGFPDCGPCFEDDDDAEALLREIVSREMANDKAQVSR